MEPEIKENVFGQPLDDKGNIIVPEVKVEVKKEEKKEDITTNPLVVELRGQIDALKKESTDKGDNLSRQGKLLKKMEGELEALKTKKTDENKQVFDNIKFSKDLTKEERDEMTPREIQLMDELAVTQQKINEVAVDDAPVAPIYDVAKAVQDEAMKLAEGNYIKAQQLIEKFNSLGLDLTKIDSDNVSEKVKAVIALVPDFVPKKEQEKVEGGAVKGTSGTDAYGISGVVAAAVAEREANSAGNYSL